MIKHTDYLQFKINRLAHTNVCLTSYGTNFSVNYPKPVEETKNHLILCPRNEGREKEKEEISVVGSRHISPATTPIRKREKLHARYDGQLIR